MGSFLGSYVQVSNLFIVLYFQKKSRLSLWASRACIPVTGDGEPPARLSARARRPPACCGPAETAGRALGGRRVGQEGGDPAAGTGWGTRGRCWLRSGQSRGGGKTTEAQRTVSAGKQGVGPAPGSDKGPGSQAPAGPEGPEAGT